MRTLTLIILAAIPAAAAEFEVLDRLTVGGPAVLGATLTVTSGVTAASATFTASGPAQYSLEAASGVKVNAGGVDAPFFIGDGSALTGIVAADPGKVAKAGDTMTGPLTLPGDPAAALHAATKQYVDSWSRPCVNPNDLNDVMVPVGPWCVDKYEASVWSTPTGGTQYGINGAADYPCGNGVTGTGQTCAAAGTKIYARSVSGVKPSTRLTWFQANIACVNAGKQLLPNAAWQLAAAGTPDPGALAQDGGPACNTQGTQSMTTGLGTSCRSSFDVENMIGSVWEWVADWGQYGQNYSGAPTNWTDSTFTDTHWPDASYGADGSWGVAGRSWNGAAYGTGLPAALIRGGNWGGGVNQTGVFVLNADQGPSRVDGSMGLRCGRRR